MGLTTVQRDCAACDLPSFNPHNLFTPTIPTTAQEQYYAWAHTALYTRTRCHSLLQNNEGLQYMYVTLIIAVKGMVVKDFLQGANVCIIHIKS